MKICTYCHLPRRSEQFCWERKGIKRETQCVFCKRKRNNIRNRYLRLQVLKHYGGDPPKCACCGQTFVEFLSLDHINGGGSQQRKKIAGSGWWRWIVRNNFPEGFRVLCHNCNQAIGIYGYCPHKQKSVQEEWATAYDPTTPNRSYKLTQKSVDEIRARILEGESQCKLALEFNVSRATICMVNKGKRWGDGAD